MKNNIQALCVSTLAIILLWAGPTTLAQTSLTEDQCIEMSHHAGDNTSASAAETNFYAGQDHGLEYSKIWYSYHLTTKVFFETECPRSEKIERFIQSRIDSMSENGRRCERLGAGSNCGVTSVDMNTYKSTAGLSKNSNSNQTQSNNDSPTPKKLSAAEQKRQNQQQQAEDLGAQSQQLAQENQSKADAARQGKRKRHDPAAEANHCIKPNSTDNNYFGSVTNTCNYDIYYTMCLYKPNEKTFLRNIACENQSFGADRIKANQKKPFYLKHSVKFYWFACKDPAWALDSEFVEGRGMKGRCKDVGASD